MEKLMKTLSKDMFIKMVNAINDVKSLDECKIKLDLLCVSIDEFCDLYTSNVVSKCPTFFKILGNLDDAMLFNPIEFADYCNWTKKLPTSVKMTSTSIEVKIGKRFSTIKLDDNFIEELSQFGIDPFVESCACMIYELYGDLNG